MELIESSSDSEYIVSDSETLTDVLYDDVSSLKEFDMTQQHEFRMAREQTKQLIHMKEKQIEITKQKQHEIDILKLRLDIKRYTIRQNENEIELLRLRIESESEANRVSTKRKIEDLSV